MEATEEEVRARATGERLRERQSLLEQEFREPVEILQSLVGAFNNASAIGKLELRERGPLTVEVTSQHGRSRLGLHAQIISDLKTRYDRIARILAIVQLNPAPSPQNRDAIYRERESFGSFNLVYRVQSESDRFGDWTQLRFEINPLIPKATFPRWFAVGLDALPRELDLLRAVGQYQHQQRPLDEEWFRELLIQLL
jgi:hypothetical protein